MRNIFLCLGSNIEDRLGYLRLALQGISELEQTSVVKVSSVYQTEPVGNKDQPDFLNIVAEVESNFSPEDLLERLKSLEIRLGRKGRARWGPREIDIDILYADGVVVDTQDFKIPHAEVTRRRFALTSLAEIAPHFCDPVLKLTISELLRVCPDRSTVRKTEFFTHLQE
ncbi:MAG: 2-amino-4-hydroxy-6-hydroxymethyldihydropteridine diphosphokinase [Ignavibacteriales bacterium]|nr:2-amino-4-hydroxy-6-hydroxymethyldihydropteridine diphosphokinase [Ignavibacteriales bacterium]